MHKCVVFDIDAVDLRLTPVQAEVGFITLRPDHSASSPVLKLDLRHGFVAVGESEFDIDYRWTVTQGVAA